MDDRTIWMLYTVASPLPLLLLLLLVPLIDGIEWTSERANERVCVCMSECVLIKQQHKNKINEKRNFSCYSSLTLILRSFLLAITHSLIRFHFVPLSLLVSIFLCYCALNILHLCSQFGSRWRWRGCKKNSWKHNEISLPFAISFGFHMVEIVSRLCVWNEWKRGWVDGEWEVEKVWVSVFVCMCVGS